MKDNCENCVKCEECDFRWRYTYTCRELEGLYPNLLYTPICVFAYCENFKRKEEAKNGKGVKSNRK